MIGTPNIFKINYTIIVMETLFFGVFCIFMSFSFYEYPVYHYVIISKGKVPICIILFFGGIYLVRNGLLQLADEDRAIKYFICPECEKLYKSSNNDHLYCRECNVELEELIGFYERYPEKKR